MAGRHSGEYCTFQCNPERHASHGGRPLRFLATVTGHLGLGPHKRPVLSGAKSAGILYIATVTAPHRRLRRAAFVPPCHTVTPPPGCIERYSTSESSGRLRTARAARRESASSRRRARSAISRPDYSENATKRPQGFLPNGEGSGRLLAGLRVFTFVCCQPLLRVEVGVVLC